MASDNESIMRTFALNHAKSHEWSNDPRECRVLFNWGCRDQAARPTRASRQVAKVEVKEARPTTRRKEKKETKVKRRKKWGLLDCDAKTGSCVAEAELEENPA